MATRITEKKRLVLNTCTERNEFYITWLNMLGARRFWNFTINQEFGQNVNNAVEYTPNFSDIGSADAVTKVLRKESTPTVTVRESFLTTEEIKALNEIQESISVYWRRDEARDIWQEIRPKPGSRTAYETDSGLHEFAITFDLQDRFIQGA